MFKLKDKYIVEEEEEEELQQHHQLVEPALTQQEADEIIQLISDSAKIICLNVGGKRFVTTQGTLCSKGSNFFTSLLSGRHTATKDDKGAYFIDRNGEVFHTILEFFRTGQVDYSSVVSKHILVREAQFYCVDELVKMITQGDCEDEVPVIRYDGYYVYEKDGMEDNPKVKIDSEICRSIRALYFLVDGRCMFSFGCNAENNLVVFNETQTLPDMWKSEDGKRDKKRYAQFVLAFIRRGQFFLEGKSLKIMYKSCINSTSTPMLGIGKGNAVYIDVNLGYGFSKFVFVPWP